MHAGSTPPEKKPMEFSFFEISSISGLSFRPPALGSETGIMPLSQAGRDGAAPQESRALSARPSPTGWFLPENTV